MDPSGGFNFSIIVSGCYNSCLDRYKYDSETFKGVLFRSTPADASRTSVLNPVNEQQTTSGRAGSKRRKLNGTAPRVDRRETDADVEMDDTKSNEGVDTSMKSIVLENDREKFLLVVVSSTAESGSEEGKEADKENLPNPASEDGDVSEKDVGLKRKFKLCILDSKREADSSETRVLRASLGVEDVRFVDGGLAVSLGGETQEDSMDEESGGLFIRVERWRWATGKEAEV